MCVQSSCIIGGKLALIAFARLLSTVLHAVVLDDLFGQEARGGRCLLPATVFASLPLLPGYSRPWPPPFSDTHASLLAYFSSVYSSCGGGGVYSYIHTIVHTSRNCVGCFSVAPQLLLVLLIYFPSLPLAGLLAAPVPPSSSHLPDVSFLIHQSSLPSLSLCGQFLVPSEIFCIFFGVFIFSPSISSATVRNWISVDISEIFLF